MTNKTRRIMKIVCWLVVICTINIWIFGWYRLGDRTYSTLGKYIEAGGERSFEIPESATECRFLIRKLVFCRGYMYSFKLDEKDCELYIEHLKEQYDIMDEAQNNEDKEKGYGYGMWYGMRVKDCSEEKYGFDKFPVGLPYSKIIDGDINDYTIIIYDPKGSGTRSYAVIVDEKTGYVVTFYMYSI